MRLTFLLLCSFLSFFAVANNDFLIRAFDVSIDVREDGSLVVEERITVFFNEKRRGIYRDIPIKYRIDGETKKIGIRDVSVDEFRFKTKRSGGKYTIRIGDPNVRITGEQEFIIYYTVDNGLLFHDAFLEFYWNITGNSWEVPIESASFSINFPESVRLRQDDIKAFSGSYGDRYDDLTWEINGRLLTGKTTKILQPQEGISVATKLSKNDFTIPEPLPDDIGSVLSRAVKKEKLFALPLVLLGLLLSWFRQKGRRRKEETSIQFYPPEDFTPTEVGYFYDHHVHDRDMMALIPKWGNEGVISMEVIGHDSDEDTIYFHKTGDLDKSVPEYERTFFDGLFESSSVIGLEDLKGVFHTIFRKSKGQFSKTNKIENLYDQHAKASFHNPWYHLIWIVLIGLGIYCMVQTYVLSGIALFALAIAGFIITLSRPRLSDRGFTIHNHLKGLRSFLADPSDVDLMHVIREDPEYLDQIFPYVVAFGLDRSWEKRTKRIRQSDPEWYYGSGMNNTGSRHTSFSDGFNVREVQSAFAHPPSSGGGYSSGGGGFSGGGVGGGGGGSW